MATEKMTQSVCRAHNRIKGDCIRFMRIGSSLQSMIHFPALETQLVKHGSAYQANPTFNVSPKTQQASYSGSALPKCICPRKGLARRVPCSHWKDDNSTGVRRWFCMLLTQV